MDLPRFDVAVGHRGVLLLTLPEQELSDRGPIDPHLVQGRLRAHVLELELYSLSQRPKFLSVGVWAVGGYVYWRNELQLDFVVLDAIDAALRAQLPPGGGVITSKRGDLLASANGVTWSWA